MVGSTSAAWTTIQSVTSAPSATGLIVWTAPRIHSHSISASRRSGRFASCYGPPPEGLDRVVERPRSLDGAEGELTGKSMVALGKPGASRSQRSIRVRIVFEHPASSPAVAGWQTRMRRRLGVSPGRAMVKGPMISTLRR